MAQSSNVVTSAGVSVYLLAENRLLRETLARLLEKRGGVFIAGVSRYTDSTVDEICASGCAILLMDSQAITHGVTLLNALPELVPRLDVVLFGMDDDSDLFLKSVYLGVSGYVLKEASASEIIAAVLGVAGDAGEQALVTPGAEQGQEFPRARDDDVAHPVVERRPGVVAALFFSGERGPVGARKIGVLHVDEKERRAFSGEVGIRGLRRAVVVDGSVVRLPAHRRAQNRFLNRPRRS